MKPPSTNQSQRPIAPSASNEFVFQGRVDPIPKRFSYQLRLWAVCIAMLVLPGVYLGLIALDIAFLAWFINSGAPAILRHVIGTGPVLLVAVILVAAVAILGILLMPVIRGRIPQPKPFVADRQRFVDLYNLVYTISDCLQAPRPTEIHLDCHANASAGFESLFDDRLMLTLGLPLFAAMDVRQLAGVIAHELAHFRQSGAMRLQYIVLRAQRWFSYLLCDPTGWELVLTLVRSPSSTGLTVLVFRAARPVLWCLAYASRPVLWCLAYTGRLCSCGLVRQMEFDSDRYAARLIGSQDFVDALDRLSILAACEEKSILVCRQAWIERRQLHDSMPGLVASAMAGLPESERGAILERDARRVTGPFDSHPARSDRMASILAERARGVFTASASADSLLGDFKALCREATLWEYSASGFRFTEANLVSDSQVAQAQQSVEESLASLDSFFHGIVVPSYPICIEVEPIDPVEEKEDTLTSLRRIREAMKQGLPEAKSALDRLVQAESQLQECDHAQTLLDTGLPVPNGAFSSPMHNDDVIDAARHKSAEQFQTASSNLDSFHCLIAARVRGAIGLLDCGKPDSNSDLRNQRDEAVRLLGTLRCFPDATKTLSRLRRIAVRLEILTHAVQEGKTAVLLPHTIASLCSHASSDLLALRKLLGNQQYPFDDMPPATPLADYAVPEYYPNPKSLTREARQAVERMSQLYRRILARLGQIAENAESSLGLMPLPAPCPPATSPAVLPQGAKQAEAP